MPYFVINGKPGCPNFIHAVFVAQYLSERLPNFYYKKIEKAARDWPEYLDELNKQNQWFMTESPVIWKEINLSGGKKYLLGGLSAFWEHVYCYYGLESLIPKYALKELADDNYKFFKDKRNSKEGEQVRYITIFGASNSLTCLLIHELLEIRNLRKANGIFVKVYDHFLSVDKNKYDNLQQDMLFYFKECKVFGEIRWIQICDCQKDAIIDADIIFYLEDFTQRKEEDQSSCLNRCNYRMKQFADDLFEYGRKGVQIVLANNGPVCYMATSLWTECSKLFPNVVVVTADRGFPYIKSVSEKTGIVVGRISAPAVWGFIGLNSFVDVKNMLFKADMIRPFKSSLTAPKNSTLPRGVIHSEIRLMSYMIKDPADIDRDVEEKTKKLYETIGRPPVFSKLRAISSLLKLWYATEVGDEIISLGVPSNGSFEIPEGVFFSQPVKLDERSRVWKPYVNFPLMEDYAKTRVRQCVFQTKKILRQSGLLDGKDLGYDENEYIEGLEEHEGEEIDSVSIISQKDGSL